MKRLVMAGLITLVVGLACAAGPPPTPTVPPATDFTFEDINPGSASFGAKITLSELYEERGVALNFLASWCGYCWKELPLLQEIDAEGGVKVVGIAADEYGGPLEAVVHMLKRYEVTLPVLWVGPADAPELEKSYAYQSLPATYLIDAQGRIAKILEGAVAPEQLREEFARAFPQSVRRR